MSPNPLNGAPELRAELSAIAGDELATVLRRDELSPELLRQLQRYLAAELTPSGMLANDKLRDDGLTTAERRAIRIPAIRIAKVNA